MTKTVRSDLALGDLADGRDRSTIRDWRKNGCPHSICTDDGRTIVYIVNEVIEWCSDRGIDFHNKENEDEESLKFHKLRQERHKANELEDKEKIRRKEYAPVSEFEETTVVLLQQVQQLMTEVVEEIKKSANLKGKEAEAIDAHLISGFNRIADIDLSE